FVYFGNFIEYYWTDGVLQAENPFKAKGEICFQFYYFFYTFGPSKFTVTMNNSATDAVDVFVVYSANENKWHKAAFTINMSKVYKDFVFKAHIKWGECFLYVP